MQIKAVQTFEEACSAAHAAEGSVGDRYFRVCDVNKCFGLSHRAAKAKRYDLGIEPLEMLETQASGKVYPALWLSGRQVSHLASSLIGLDREAAESFMFFSLFVARPRAL